ncbi:hypothetical protein C1H66_15960, partial [Halomonas heilongjiangensis]
MSDDNPIKRWTAKRKAAVVMVGLSCRAWSKGSAALAPCPERGCFSSVGEISGLEQAPSNQVAPQY